MACTHISMKYAYRVCFPSIRQFCSSINKKNHYKTLEIPMNASAKEIKVAFYELSKKYHPDASTNDNSAKSATLFQNVIFFL